MRVTLLTLTAISVGICVFYAEPHAGHVIDVVSYVFFRAMEGDPHPSGIWGRDELPG
jgi:hypothetical protein